jgi:hypothetical protein
MLTIESEVLREHRRLLCGANERLSCCALLRQNGVSNKMPRHGNSRSDKNLEKNETLSIALSRLHDKFMKIKV